jgi:hypothetical protein
MTTPEPLTFIRDVYGNELGMRLSHVVLYAPEGTEFGVGGCVTRVWFSSGPSAGALLAISPESFKKLFDLRCVRCGTPVSEHGSNWSCKGDYP